MTVTLSAPPPSTRPSPEQMRKRLAAHVRAFGLPVPPQPEPQAHSPEETP